MCVDVDDSQAVPHRGCPFVSSRTSPLASPSSSLTSARAALFIHGSSPHHARAHVRGTVVAGTPQNNPRSDEGRAQLWRSFAEAQSRLCRRSRWSAALVQKADTTVG